MNFLKWHLLNLLSIAFSLATLFVVGVILYLKLNPGTGETHFIFRTWWHTGFALLAVMSIGGCVVNFFDDRKPAKHEEKRKISAARKASEAKEIEYSKQYKPSHDWLNFLFGGLLGFLIGRNRKPKPRSDRYKLYTWTTRAKSRGGSALTYEERDDAINRAYDWMKRNNRGEAKVVDQETGNTILRLP